MTAIYSDTEQTAALAAATAAANGVKRAAWLTSWQTAIGSGARVALYRDSVRVWHGTITGTLTITGTAFVIETAAQVSIAAADIDSGSWELRVEKASDAAVYFGCTVTRAGGTNIGALSDDLTGTATLDIGTLTFNAPPFDTVTSSQVQASAVVDEANVGSVQMTFSTQPTAGNKILVPWAYYEGFRGLTDPDDVSATLWTDLSDFSTLYPTTDATGSITAVGQLVKRVTNLGSAGGYFSSSTGWYLRQDAGGGYYLEMSGTTEFVSSIASSAIIGAAAGEVIVAVRPDTAASYDPDYWYQPSAWEAGDGRAGVSFKSATVAQAWNGTNAVSLTQVQSDDQLVTWRHTGGVLSGAVGFDSDPATTIASGDTTSISTAFAIGGAYHGSYPRLSGRFYGIVAKNSALSTAHRDFVQGYLSRQMDPVVALDDPSVTDNAGNTFSVVASKSDGSRLLVGLAVCENVAAGSGTYTVTVSAPGGSGYSISAQAAEYDDLIGAGSVDVTGGATNDGSAGSLAITTAATTQANELAIAVFGLYNSDSNANMTAPSGYTEIGAVDDAANIVALLSAEKGLTAIGAQSATGTWDAGSAGGAAGVLVTFKTGENTDPPSGGTGGTDLTLNLMALDVNTGVAHEYIMDGLPAEWSWGTYCRPGVGANPPQVAGWTAPAWVPWGHAATETGNPPGTCNWRLGVHAIYHAERRNGVWEWTGTQATTSAQIEGSIYLDYETNDIVAADTRTSNGFLEVKFPTTGGAFHFYPTFRTAIATSGAEHRVALLKLSLTEDDEGEADDRASAAMAALAGGDYWKSMSQGWDPNSYSNDDFWIGRARKPALYPDMSWHTVHTMTADADIEAFIVWADAQGILD